MICAVINGSTIQVLNTAPCAVNELVLVTAAEYATANASPFILTIAEGASISGAIALVWAVAWGYKQLMKSVNGGNPE